jgi:glycerol uptake facilitator-like aquaporin
MGGIFAIGDGKNAKLPAAAGPYTVALLVMVIGMSYGMLTVCAVSPAGDGHWHVVRHADGVCVRCAGE